MTCGLSAFPELTTFLAAKLHDPNHDKIRTYYHILFFDSDNTVHFTLMLLRTLP